MVGSSCQIHSHCVATSRALSLPLSSAITARAASPPALTPLEVTTSFPGRDLSSTHLATRQREWEKERETQISPMPSVQEREEERGQPNAKRERERERESLWLSNVGRMPSPDDRLHTQRDPVCTKQVNPRSLQASLDDVEPTSKAVGLVF